MLVRYGLAAPIFVAALMSALSLVCTLCSPVKSAFALRKAMWPFPALRQASVGLRVARFLQYFERPVLRAMLIQFLVLRDVLFGVHVSGFSLLRRASLRLRRTSVYPREIGYLFAFSGFWDNNSARAE